MCFKICWIYIIFQNEDNSEVINLEVYLNITETQRTHGVSRQRWGRSYAKIPLQQNIELLISSSRKEKRHKYYFNPDNGYYELVNLIFMPFAIFHLVYIPGEQIREGKNSTPQTLMQICLLLFQIRIHQSNELQ